MRRKCHRISLMTSRTTILFKWTFANYHPRGWYRLIFYDTDPKPRHNSGREKKYTNLVKLIASFISLRSMVISRLLVMIPTTQAIQVTNLPSTPFRLSCLSSSCLKDDCLLLKAPASSRTYNSYIKHLRFRAEAPSFWVYAPYRLWCAEIVLPVRGSPSSNP